MKNNILKHDLNSPMLISDIEPEDKISDRKIKSYRTDQLEIFNLYKAVRDKMTIDKFFKMIEWSIEDEEYALSLGKDERLLLAKNCVYDGILIDLSFDKEKSIVLAVVSNNNTPQHVLERLANVRDVTVAEAAKIELGRRKSEQ